MGSDYTGDALTAAVIDSFVDTPDPRLREILTSLVRHLHDFGREVQLTQEEWERGIEFLTALGQKCDATRQEWVLCSDVLGMSMVVETMADGNRAGATEGTVLGPFHMVASPERRSGDTIDLVGAGRPCVVEVRVLTVDGTPLLNATVDVWQANEQGFYDVQQPEIQPPGNGRGLFRTDEQGQVWFRTVEPSPYPIPTDGPVGTLLELARRHPYRPAHIHFIATAPGYETLTTHIFLAGSPYLDSDAVFAVKEGLVVEFTGDSDQNRHALVDLVLAPRRPDRPRTPANA
jgi:hydroxyquinol 1,2-dioxygenase